MFIQALVIDGQRVGVRSTVDLHSALQRVKTQPNFAGLGVEQDGTTCRFFVEYRESDQPRVRYSRASAFVEAPWAVIETGDLLVYAALPFVELQHQQKGFVTAHAAAVSLDGKALMLFGKEGAGKTSTALGLCRWHGAKLIGNDLVLIGGTKFFHLRYESMRKNMPELLTLFPQSQADPWLQKVFCQPEDLNVEVRHGITIVSRAYLVHVDDTTQGLFVKPADDIVTRLYLNENLSRYIRGTSIALFGNDRSFLGYVPSFDSEALFQKRKALMERILTLPPMMYVSGALREVVAYIRSQPN
jgi:hypothetical protein